VSETAATVALVARVDLAAAFALSAGAKLADLPATAAGLAAFGAPSPHLAARVLPALEAALAVALLAFADRPEPAHAALVMVAVFTWFVARRLMQGRAVPCPCFGGHGDRPVSVLTLVRNGLLLALCVVAGLPSEGAAMASALLAAAVTVPLVAVALRRTA
jgi:hypothetical protein